MSGRWGARAQDATPFEILRGRRYADIQREINDPAISEGRRKQLRDALAQAEKERLGHKSARYENSSWGVPHKFIPSREQH